MRNVEELEVPLIGPGQRFRKSGVYGPGEYKSLKNLVMTPQGTLKKRQPAMGLMHAENIRLSKIIGPLGREAVYTRNTDFQTPLLYRSNEATTSVVALPMSNWAALRSAIITASAFPAGYTSTAFTFEGTLTYNGVPYFIVCHSGREIVGGTTINYRINHYVIKAAWYPVSNVLVFDLTLPPNKVDATTYQKTIEVVNFNEVPYNPLSYFGIHKDRMVLAIRDTVYLSKATDPLVWAVPDGAFFKFPGKPINALATIGDNIYTVLDTAVYVTSYTQGPNTDMRSKLLSGNVGGDSAVVYLGDVYIIRYDSVYMVSGQNISKVLDLENSPSFNYNVSSPTNNYNDLTGGSRSEAKAVVYNGAIYMYQRSVVFDTLAGNLIFNTRYETNESFVLAFELLRIDLDLGCVTQINFEDNYVSKRVSDIFVNYEATYLDQPTIYFLAVNDSPRTQCFYSQVGAQLFTGVGSLGPGYDGGLDSYSNSAGNALVIGPISYKAELIGVTPDELKYYVKKFRSLLLQGDIPQFFEGSNTSTAVYVSDLQVTIGYNINSGAFVNNSNRVVEETPGLSPLVGNNATKGYRIPVNQRAKSVNITIHDKYNNSFKAWTAFNSNYYNEVALANSILELEDLRLLYTMSNRGPSGAAVERS